MTAAGFLKWFLTGKTAKKKLAEAKPNTCIILSAGTKIKQGKDFNEKFTHLDLFVVTTTGFGV